MDPAIAKEITLLSRKRAIDEAIERGESEVQQFYKDATVLISGGTGFLGKQLIEKLFRSCDIKKVFLLLRPKKKTKCQERLSIMLADPVFDAVRKAKPGFEERICPINADMAEPRLGISDEDRAKILAETDIIIHAAATINFNEPLRVAVNTNVRGSVEMLNIGKQCPKLKSYVHVSTAFSHATVDKIDKDVLECFYDAPMPPAVAIDLVATVDEQRINDITPDLIKGWPNTYTFTKAIAEEACRLAAADLPISIVRPAVVIASNLEPSPGWLDMSSVFGPSGFVVGIGLGLIHVKQVDEDKNIDLVPVDIVNNAVIATAWLTVKRRSAGDFEPKIYTVTSSRNSITYKRTIDILMKDVAHSLPSTKAPYYIFVTKIASPFIYFLLSWLWHYIPAYIGDVVLRIMGKRPVAVKLYDKVAKSTKVYSYFTKNNWLMGDNNLQELYSGLNKTDKQIFNCTNIDINWNEYLAVWALGCRKYIAKDGLQGTEEAIKKQFKLKLLHYFVVCPIYFYCLYKVATFAFMLLNYVISTVIGI